MKVKILDKNNIREGIPVELKISEVQSRPKVEVVGLGKVDVIKRNGDFIATFWSMEEGLYRINVTSKNSSWSEEILINKQDYLDFKSEFSFFSLSLFLGLLGVFVWMRKKKGA